MITRRIFLVAFVATAIEAHASTALTIMNCTMESMGSKIAFSIGKSGDDFYAHLKSKESFVATPLKAKKTNSLLTFSGTPFRLELRLPPESGASSTSGKIDGTFQPVKKGPKPIKLKGQVSCEDRVGILSGEDPNSI